MTALARSEAPSARFRLWKKIAAAEAIARARWYRAKYALLGVRLHAGRNLRVYGRLDVRGPGTITLGDDTMVIGRARLYTHGVDARLTMGDRVIIGGLHVDCARDVTIGSDCLLGDAYVADTACHSVRADRHDPRAPVKIAPVSIGDNVWVAQFAGVLAGSHIGKNSVVSCGSVCSRSYPDDVILVGNPARPAGAVAGAPAPSVARESDSELVGAPA